MKIVDFGLAISMDKTIKKCSKADAGTMSYKAPEQFM